MLFTMFHVRKLESDCFVEFLWREDDDYPWRDPDDLEGVRLIAGPWPMHAYDALRDNFTLNELIELDEQNRVKIAA